MPILNIKSGFKAERRPQLKVVLKTGEIVTLSQMEGVSLKNLKNLIKDNPEGTMAAYEIEGYLKWQDIDLAATQKLQQNPKEKEGD